MRALSREAILAIDDLRKELVEVPEWSGSVWVRTMTGAERDGFLADVVGQDSKVDRRAYRARLLSACVVDDDGKSLFTPEQMGARNTLVLDRLMLVADRLNSVTEESVAAAEKNSARGPSVDSSAAGQ